MSADWIDEELSAQAREVMGPRVRVCVTNGGQGEHQAWIEFDDGMGVNLNMEPPNPAARAIVVAIVGAMLEHKQAIQATLRASQYGFLHEHDEQAARG